MRRELILYESNDVLITPEALQQFKLIYLQKHPAQPPLKNSERTIRRMMRNSLPPDARLKEILGEELPGTDYLVNDGFWVFTIIPGEQLALVSVRSRHEMLKAYSREKQQKALAASRAKKKVAQEPPLDLAKVRLTGHARKQFAERFESKLENSEEEALARLSRATEHNAIEPEWKVRRIIDNGFKEVRYFRDGNCRFVIKELPDGTFSILTIEWA